MLFIEVKGVPPETDTEMLFELLIDMQRATAQIRELELDTSDVNVFFTPDLLKCEMGEKIIVTVNGLFEKSLCPPEVSTRLAEALGQITKRYFTGSRVACLIYTRYPASGFWSS
jgi:hypothetical protein